MSGSILEVFGILFESNADDLKKGTKEAEKAVDELDESIDSSTEGSKKLGKSFDVAASSARLLMGTAAVMGAAFVTMASQAANMLAEGRLSANLGQDIEKFHAMGAAIQELTGDANDYGSSLLGIRDKLLAVQMGDSGARATFLKIGIQPVDSTGKARNPSEVFNELVDAVNRSKYPQLAMSFARDAGLESSVASAAQKVSSSEILKIAAERSEIYTVSDEDVERSKQLNNALARAGDSISRVIKEFGKELIPLITESVNAFTDLIMSNLDTIKSAAESLKLFIKDTQDNMVLFLEDPIAFLKKSGEGAAAIANDGVNLAGSLAAEGAEEPFLKGMAKSVMLSLAESAKRSTEKRVRVFGGGDADPVAAPAPAESPAPLPENVFDLMKYVEEQTNKAINHPANSITPSLIQNINNEGANDESTTIRIEAPVSININGANKNEKEIAQEVADIFSVHINRLGVDFSTNIAS